ncbi:MAG: NAD(P)-dependent oxidoreductase, partial [Clostridium sp.]|nr:NAD(P)-dependent oxidoreductase [Clostridium sp.]
MKILITGVYGIIGSYLCEKLRNEGFYVVGIGRKDKYNDCDKYYCCDIINIESIEKVFKENADIEIVIHCAALAHNKGDDLSRERFIKVNYDGTKNLVDMCNKYLKLKSFIFLSTISVYGERLNISEYREYETLNPKTPYAVSKKLSESYIRENLKGDYSILRLASVYSKNFDRNIRKRTEIKGLGYTVGNGFEKLSLCNIKNI